MSELVTLQTINLPDGRVAKLIVPELVQELAIVDLNVIKRLAALLPQASLRTIRNEFKEKLDRCNTMAEYVEMLRNELSFHETVNIIATISPEQVEEQRVAEAPASVRAY